MFVGPWIQQACNACLEASIIVENIADKNGHRGIETEVHSI